MAAVVALANPSRNKQTLAFYHDQLYSLKYLVSVQWLLTQGSLATCDDFPAKRLPSGLKTTAISVSDACVPFEALFDSNTSLKSHTVGELANASTKIAQKL